jgi:hypothetical protein
VAENSLFGWNGGFDVNIGNPPWDRVKLQEKEWFAERVPEIAKATNASKRKQSSVRDEFERFHRRIYDFGQSYSAFRARTRSWFGWSVTHFKSGCQLDLEASDITF